VAIDRIDETLVRFGFPVGPFALLDEVGLDVSARSRPSSTEAFGERMKPLDDGGADAAGRTLRQEEREGLLPVRRPALEGQEGGGQASTITRYRPDNADMEPEAIIDRTVLMMLNEAARCHEEGVIRSPRDGDIGAIFGIGFPPFRGGPFRYMDARGIGDVVKQLQELQSRHDDRFAPAEVLLSLARESGQFHQT
jgi:3-hydroxyacyl-CoA dehydrogenase / enoyl-CoA hydratase / 3-hydroxybutyryl-CoA epimerase